MGHLITKWRKTMPNSNIVKIYPLKSKVKETFFGKVTILNNWSSFFFSKNVKYVLIKYSLHAYIYDEYVKWKFWIFPRFICWIKQSHFCVLWNAYDGIRWYLIGGQSSNSVWFRRAWYYYVDKNCSWYPFFPWEKKTQNWIKYISRKSSSYRENKMKIEEIWYFDEDSSRNIV